MTDIILIVVGIGIVLVSFLIGGKEKEEKGQLLLTQEQLDGCFDLLEPELRKHVMELISDCKDETVVKADDELGKLADEKYLQIQDYAKQVLEKIENNHQEVVFLYKMLSEKEESIKEEMVLLDQQVMKKKQEISKRLEELAKEEQMIGTKKKEIRKREEQADELIRQMERSRTSLNEQEEAERRLEEMLNPSGRKRQQESVEERSSYVSGERLDGRENEQQTVNETGESRNDTILRMHREGYSVLDISRELSMGQGEVGLIVELYERRRKG